MAIQFHCPYCTAAVRVGDESAGRQGRCPKCDTLLIVPVVQKPSDNNASSTDDLHAELSDTSPAVRRQADITIISDTTESSDRTASTAEALPIPEFPAMTTASVTTPRRRRRSRRRNVHRVWLIGIPVLCFLILLGVLASFMVSRLPELRGPMQATPISSAQLPAQHLEWSLSGLTEEDRQALQVALTAEPASFSSSLMSCTITATPEAMQVRLRAAAGQQWYAVDPAANQPLALWLRRNTSELAALRAGELQAGIASFSSEMRRLSAGESIVLDAQNYRNSVGLNSSVGVLGYILEASIAGRVSRCAFEDHDGRLYFLFPQGTQSFQLRGRKLANGTVPFPGEYQVTVVNTVISEPADVAPTTSPDLDPEMEPPTDGQNELPMESMSEAAEAETQPEDR